jgi:uncharacterized protein (DUF305 family)
MKHYLLLASILFMIACNNEKKETETTTDVDTVTHNEHSADTTSPNGQNHMKTMHDAMSGMMTRMESMKPSGNPDHDFAMLMKHHHEGAIAMAQAEIAGGSDATMKQKAQKMIDDQQREISAFDKVIQSGIPSGNSDFGQKALKMMTPMGEIKMESGSLDAMFASMMIPHHNDAIKMAREYLKAGTNNELKTLAQNIITAQQKEIGELQEWLNSHRS